MAGDVQPGLKCPTAGSKEWSVTEVHCCGEWVAAPGLTSNRDARVQRGRGCGRRRSTARHPFCLHLIIAVRQMLFSSTECSDCFVVVAEGLFQPEPSTQLLWLCDRRQSCVCLVLCPILDHCSVKSCLLLFAASADSFLPHFDTRIAQLVY